MGYATTTIGAETLTENRSANFMNTLQGKVAGVNISGLGTGPAGTSKVRIRGQSSISGQNNPLVVVNGVPIDNTNFGTNPGNAAADNSVGVRGGGNTSDGGDGLSSINPDDIESMTILKGATAAALYGSRAKDGVIMITTKTKGSKKELALVLILIIPMKHLLILLTINMNTDRVRMELGQPRQILLQDNGLSVKNLNRE